MSILYYVGLFSSAIGITLSILLLLHFIDNMINYGKVHVYKYGFIFLFISVLLTIFGIDMLINLDKF